MYFLGLCIVFGTAVWMLEIQNSIPRSLLAALPTAVETAKEPETSSKATEAAHALKNAGAGANSQCPTADPDKNEEYNRKYKPGKRNETGPKGGIITKTNFYGTRCSNGKVSGYCRRANDCYGGGGGTYTDLNKKLKRITANADWFGRHLGKGYRVAGPTKPLSGFTPLQRSYQAFGGQFPRPSGGSTFKLSDVYGSRAQPSRSNPGSASGGSRSSDFATGYSNSPPASRGIDAIAGGSQGSSLSQGTRSGGSYSGGQANYGEAYAPAQYAPSGNLNSFSGLGGSSYNSGYGAGGGSLAYGGGGGDSYAYGGGGTSPGGYWYDDPYYGSFDSQNTFAPPRLPRDIIAELDKFPKPKLGQDILRDSRAITRRDSSENLFYNVNDVISGVSDFFTSLFGPSKRKELPLEEQIAEKERKELRFYLETGNLLVAGDPSILPEEIPDDALLSLQPQDPRRGFSDLPVSYPATGTVLPDEGVSRSPISATEVINAIADSGQRMIEGGYTTSTEIASGLEEISGVSQISIDAGENKETGTPASEGVIAKLQKSFKILVSTIVGAIKASLLRILSWFY